MKRRMTALAATAALSLLALAGCTMPGGPMYGGPMYGNDNGTSNSDDRNSADLMFVMMMIPHHQDAIEMSDLLLKKDDIPDGVGAMAEQIKAAQQPEIDLMESWLDQWGVAGSMGGMNHGMMSGDDMAALDDATGDAAADLFLEQMIVHHDGAIVMAEQVIGGGRNQDVRVLAESIVVSQAAEIATMRQLLGG